MTERKPLQYCVVHPRPEFASAMADVMRCLPGLPAPLLVTEMVGKLEDLVREGFRADAIIGPGNSYGDMTGGFDQAIMNVSSQDLQTRLHVVIQERFLGEMNVGQATIIPFVNSPFFEQLVYAPTMRVPMRLPQQSDVPYVSMLAALQAIRDFNESVTSGRRFSGQNPIRSVAFTYHGHGTGDMLPLDIVRQMSMAIAQYEHPQQRDIGSGRFHHGRITGIITD